MVPACWPVVLLITATRVVVVPPVVTGVTNTVRVPSGVNTGAGVMLPVTVKLLPRRVTPVPATVAASVAVLSTAWLVSVGSTAKLWVSPGAGCPNGRGRVPTASNVKPSGESTGASGSVGASGPRPAVANVANTTLLTGPGASGASDASVGAAERA